MQDTTAKAYTATDLKYYAEDNSEEAAAYASDLIATYDLSETTPARAAREIAEETSAAYPASGANDTASREALWAILSATETMSDRLIRSDRTREALKKARA